MNSIPAKQLLIVGTNSELALNLLDREIGWSTEDDTSYIKLNGELVKFGGDSSIYWCNPTGAHADTYETVIAAVNAGMMPMMRYTVGANTIILSYTRTEGSGEFATCYFCGAYLGNSNRLYVQVCEVNKNGWSYGPGNDRVQWAMTTQEYDASDLVDGANISVFPNAVFRMVGIPATITKFTVDCRRDEIPVSTQYAIEFTLPAGTAFETLTLKCGGDVCKVANMPQTWEAGKTYQITVLDGCAAVGVFE